MPGDLVVLILIVFAGAIGLVLCGGRLVGNFYQVQLNSRLRDLAVGGTPREGGARRPVSQLQRDSANSGKIASRWITDSAEDRKHQQTRLIQAGIYNPKALFGLLLLKVLLISIPPLASLIAIWLGLIDFRRGLLWGALAGGLGMILPSLWLESRIRRRHCILRRSLADFLDLMIVCLESGLSLQGTILRVSDELRLAHPDLAGELAIVQRDMNLGATVDAALRRFADRSGYDGIRSLATFVREAQRFGTQLAEALRLHADMLRSQRENAAEETAQKAAVKILIPMLLLILPAVFIVLAGPAAIQIQQAFAK